MSGQAHEDLVPMNGEALDVSDAHNSESSTDIEELFERTYKAWIKSLTEAFQLYECWRKMRLLQRAIFNLPTGANELSIIYQA